MGGDNLLKMKSTTFVAVVLSLMAQVDCQGNNKNSIKDETLLNICTGPLLDNPDGRPPNDRIQDNYCEQKMNFKVPKEMETEACQDLSPFPVKSAVNENGFLKCQWESTSRCSTGHVHIYDHCFVVGRQEVVYSEARKTCEDGGMRLHRATDRDAMWISILFNHDLLWVANAVSGSRTKTDAVWTAVGGGSFVNSKSNDVAIHLDAEYEFDVNAGQLVTVKEGEVLRPLCSYNAHQLPNSAKRVDYFIPSVLVQPRMTSDHKVDTSSFHEICAKRMPGFRAGLANEGTKLDEYLQKEEVGIIYVANQLDKHAEGSENCDPKHTGQFYAKDFEAVVPDKKGFRTEKHAAADWQTEQPKPDNLCSDYGRMAVAYETGKGAVDVPPIARYPIICVPDGNITLKPTYLCPSHSNVVNGDGCECKEGMVDFADTNFTSNHRQEFPRGIRCAYRNCHNENKKMHMIFVVDNSGSIGKDNYDNDVIPFLQMAKDSLHSETKITFIQYSNFVKLHATIHKWSKQQFADLFNKKYLDSMTCTVIALQKAKGILDADKDSDERRVILITDGVPSCLSLDENHINEQIGLMKTISHEINDEKTRMLAVGIGPWLHEHGGRGMAALIKAVGPENYMDLGGEFNTLAETEMNRLTAEICAPMSDETFGL